MSSLSDRLEAAALALSGSEGIKERLHNAWSAHLADLELRDFPREVREEFAAMIGALSRERALPGDSILKASLRKMSHSEAAQYAGLIVRTYGRVAALKTPPVALVPRSLPVPAPFLVEQSQAATR